MASCLSPVVVLATEDGDEGDTGGTRIPIWSMSFAESSNFNAVVRGQQVLEKDSVLQC